MSVSELGRCPFCGSQKIVINGIFLCPNCAREEELEELDQMETFE